MMDDRKRPFEALDSPTTTAAAAGGAGLMPRNVSSNKKRQLDRSTSLLNGGRPQPSRGPLDDGEETPAYKGLEDYRKEAIYRRFLEGQRDLSRAEQKIWSLQQQVGAFEQRSAAFRQSWDLLMEDIKTLLLSSSIGAEKPDLVSAVEASKAATDAHSLQAALLQGAEAVKTTFSLLVTLGQGTLASSEAQLQERCHELAREATNLRTAATTTQGAFEKAGKELKEAMEQLRRAERQRDRLLSPSVRVVEKSGELKQEANTNSHAATPVPEAVAQDGTPLPTPAPNSLPAVSATDADPPRSAGGGGVANGLHHAEQVEDLERIASARLVEAEELRAQVVTLRSDNERLKTEALQVPESRVVDSWHYLELRRHAEELQNELSRAKAEWEAVRIENVELRDSRASFETLSKEQANLVVEELRKQIQSRDADILRLRTQRDEIQADLQERKHRETAKMNQLEEIKALAEAKEVSIVKLRQDVRRLQLVLAAKRGDSTTHQSLASNEADLDLDIEGRLARQLESVQAALRESLARNEALQAASAAGSDLALDNARLSVRLKELESQLAAASASASASASSSGVGGGGAGGSAKEREEEIAKLRAQVEATDKTVEELCVEIERLGSSSSNDAEKQFAHRVVDFSRLEDKVARLTQEKSKADNKYFSAMRARDAIDAEKAVLNRTMERQNAVIERYAEMEKTFGAQMQRYEAEITLLQKSLEEHKGKIADLEIGIERSNAKEREASTLAHKLEEMVQERVRSEEAANAERSRLAERVAQLEKDLERSKRAIASGVSSNKKGSSTTAADNELEALNALLRCSSCKENYRNRVIVKCLHTFCAACVDSRIQTRQRKCPHCGLAFAVSDVQPLYLQ